MINSLSALLYRKEYKKFIGIKDIEKVQKDKLMEIIRNNKDSEFGQKFYFKDIGSVASFQKNLPLSQYEDYESYIEKIKKGEEGVLTSERVLLLEPTSGSTSASKYIPYTASLKKDFQKALKPWIYNLYTSYRGVRMGKSYWSISPAASENQYSQGGIPIGFEEDSAYFGNFEKILFDMIFAVDNSVAKLRDMDEFYKETCYKLLMTRNLSLISVWNPTFLLLLLDYIEENIEDLYKRALKKDNRRAKEIKAAVEPKNYEALWPYLKLISCWCDGNSRKYADRVKDIFPNTHIQAKGLLATEAFVSFPLKGEKGARLALTSHFFEFRSLKDEKIYLAHEIKEGEEYSIILTTSGGLYRYRLNDVVEVTGRAGIFPLISFKRKEDKVSDIFGEKLHEDFLNDLMEKLQLGADFYMFAPEEDRYVLYIKSENIPNNIDKKLRENFHYDYCRKLGQLKELKIFKVKGNPEEDYIWGSVGKGQRMGDIKPTTLSLYSGWDKIFEGEYI